VEELLTDPPNSRLTTWLGWLDCQQAAKYPETHFFIFRENSPNLTSTKLVWGSSTSFFLEVMTEVMTLGYDCGFTSENAELVFR
jgi:hypothetical protein